MIKSRTTVVRRCDQCQESMTLHSDQAITEATAIELGSWLTVSSERVTPEGIQVEQKHYCSAQCLADCIGPLVAEYKAAEGRAIDKLMAPDPPEAKPALAKELDDYDYGYEWDDSDGADPDPAEDKPDLEALQAIAKMSPKDNA